MKHRTWFRLVLKAIGILLVGMAIPGLAGWSGRMVFGLLEIAQSGRGFIPDWDITSYHTLNFIMYASQLGFGLYLFFGGAWIVDLCIPTSHPYCPACGYDLINSKGSRCSECGVQLPDELARGSKSAPEPTGEP